MRLCELLERYSSQYVPTIIDQARTRSCIKHLMAIDCEAEDISRQTLIDYRRSRVGAGVSESTVNREMAVIGSALKWARHEGLTKANPELPRTREISSVKVMSFKQFASLSDHAPDLKTWAFINLLFYTGQRKQAILNLKHSQIRDGLIHFNEQEGALAHRRKRRATTPISGKITAVLARLKAEYGDTEYVIPRGKTGHFVTLDKLFALAAVKARVSWATPHVLRHSACSILLANKRSMLEASKFLGHSSVQITERVYSHFSPDYLAGASAVMDSL